MEIINNYNFKSFKIYQTSLIKYTLRQSSTRCDNHSFRVMIIIISLSPSSKSKPLLSNGSKNNIQDLNYNLGTLYKS